jgi:DinB family protein/pentapeptide repeat protein
VSTYTDSAEFRGATFVDLDMSGAVFREVDLSGARMYGVLLTGADIDGDLTGLRLNGVDVAPLVEAELDRQYPVRTKLRPTTPGGARDGLAAVEEMWRDAVAYARTFTDDELHRSINDEWSFVATLRHLVFVTDAWFGHALLGRSRPFHPIGLPAGFIANGAELGLELSADPTLDEVLAVRAGRFAQVRDYLAAASQDELDRLREPNNAPGWPPPAARTGLKCLRVVFSDEWAHHQFARRDLAIIAAQR